MAESVASSDFDEVSSVSSSNISRKSKASFITVDSLFSAKAKEAAKKADLLTKVAFAKERQALKEQKLKLEFEQEQLELRTQLQIVNAREKALSDNLIHEIGRPIDKCTPIRSKSPKLPVDQVSNHSAVSSHGKLSDRLYETPQRNEIPSPADQGHVTPTVHLPVETAQRHNEVCGKLSDKTPQQNEIPLSTRQDRVTPVGSVEQKDNIRSLIKQQNEMQKRQTHLSELMLEQHERSLLPQPHINKFRGDPLNYQSFVKSFENRIERKLADYSDRLYYLEQLTEGEPNQLVRSCLHMEPQKGYIKALESLQKRYGDEYKIASAYTSKLLKWPPIKTENSMQLSKFAIYLSSCLNAMKDVGYLDEMNHSKSLLELMEKLPYNCKERWRRNAAQIRLSQYRKVDFQDFVEFVNAEVDIVTDPVFGKSS
ncbi:uncharacterized protein LOC126817746 [Patella vulgata]|uniref:uncharacterized protein LOC126817746 n=1 Tax=Patella vulgata TaxID=6465 RepID=UPI00217F237E|nr:uncharacterized protein LOC126817746 [Patella vulgata]